MRVTQKVKKILDWYEGDNPGVKANLARDGGSNGSIIGRNTFQRPKSTRWRCWAGSSTSTLARA